MQGLGMGLQVASAFKWEPKIKEPENEAPKEKRIGSPAPHGATYPGS